MRAKKRTSVQSDRYLLCYLLKMYDQKTSDTKAKLPKTTLLLHFFSRVRRTYTLNDGRDIDD